jgi:hypothetical protein
VNTSLSLSLAISCSLIDCVGFATDNLFLLLTAITSLNKSSSFILRLASGHLPPLLPPLLILFWVVQTQIVLRSPCQRQFPVHVNHRPCSSPAPQLQVRLPNKHPPGITYSSNFLCPILPSPRPLPFDRTIRPPRTRFISACSPPLPRLVLRCRNCTRTMRTSNDTRKIAFLS